MKAGDEKDLDITFPEDYHKDLAGKAVVFKVKVHEVKEKEIPPWTMSSPRTSASSTL